MKFEAGAPGVVRKPFPKFACREDDPRPSERRELGRNDIVGQGTAADHHLHIRGPDKGGQPAPERAQLVHKIRLAMRDRRPAKCGPDACAHGHGARQKIQGTGRGFRIASGSAQSRAQFGHPHEILEGQHHRLVGSLRSADPRPESLESQRPIERHPSYGARNDPKVVAAIETVTRDEVKQLRRNRTVAVGRKNREQAKFDRTPAGRQPTVEIGDLSVQRERAAAANREHRDHVSVAHANHIGVFPVELVDQPPIRARRMLGDLADKGLVVQPVDLVELVGGSGDFENRGLHGRAG